MQQELFQETVSAKLEAAMREQAVAIQNGTWTVQNQTTREHRTFRIRTQSKNAKFAPGARILSVMSGTDNEKHYTNFAFVRDDEVHIWKAKQSTKAPGMYEWYADMIRVLLGKMPSLYGKKYLDYTIEGSGQCYICNKKLTNPLSLETGIGPVCAGRE